LLVDANKNDPAAGYRILRDDILEDAKKLGLNPGKNRIFYNFVDK